MSRIEVASEVGDDFDRVVRYLERYEASDAAASVAEVDTLFVLALRSQREAGSK